MKKIVFFTAIAVSSLVTMFTASAQQPDECMLYLSYYQEYYKQGTKDSKLAALPSWRKAYNICAPNTRQNLYIHGADLYRLLIRGEKNAEKRAALVDTLITLHKLRAQYYPKYANKAYAALSTDVNNYLKNDPQKTHEILSELINQQGKNTAPVAFVANMNAVLTLYSEEKLGVDDVLNEYNTSVMYFDEIQKTDTTENTRNIRAMMENAFIASKVATCDALQNLFAARFDQISDSAEDLGKMIKLMASAEDCTSNDLFLKAVTKMYQIEPSATSAYNLFRMHASKKNVQEALHYADEAVAAETDNASSAKYCYEEAAFCLMNNMYAKSYDLASKAISLDSSYSGKCYMIMGHAWMGVSCGGNEVERRAKYWAAADYFNRAKAADSSLAADASKQAGSCASYFPDQAEAFMYNLQNGDPYTVSCSGMRASTTVRTR